MHLPPASSLAFYEMNIASSAVLCLHLPLLPSVGGIQSLVALRASSEAHSFAQSRRTDLVMGGVQLWYGLLLSGFTGAPVQVCMLGPRTTGLQGHSLRAPQPAFYHLWEKAISLPGLQLKWKLLKVIFPIIIKVKFSHNNQGP